MTAPRLTVAIVETLEQAHDLQRELSRAGVQAFVTRKDWRGQSRPMVGYFAADQRQAKLLSEMLAATGMPGEVFFDDAQAEAGWAIVFAHPSLQVAHMMRNLLDHHEIEAKVLGAGPRSHESMGLLDLFCVAAPHAREAEAATVVDESLQRMAQQHLAERGGDEPRKEEDEEADADVLIEWPHCPQCGQPRETMCLKCRHIGHHLPQAETPVDAEDLAAIRKEPQFVELLTGEPGVVTGGPPAGGLAELADRPQPHTTDEALWVLCPICDWLFQPTFYRRCAWCSHNFGDGLDIQPPPNLEREPINFRMLLLAGGLLALMLAVLFYFGSLGK